MEEIEKKLTAIDDMYKKKLINSPVKENLIFNVVVGSSSQSNFVDCVSDFRGQTAQNRALAAQQAKLNSAKLSNRKVNAYNVTAEFRWLCKGTLKKFDFLGKCI